MLCNGKTARLAAIYPFELCRAILEGFARQMELDGKMTRGSVGLHLAEEVDEGIYIICNAHGEILKMRVDGEEEFRDDLTGQLLDPKLVREARAKEMEYAKVQGLMDQETGEGMFGQDRPPTCDGEVGRY